MRPDAYNTGNREWSYNNDYVDPRARCSAVSPARAISSVRPVGTLPERTDLTHVFI
jgi:hypothetical protein